MESIHQCQVGWQNIAGELTRQLSGKTGKTIIVAECYPGVHEKELLAGLTGAINPDHTCLSVNGMKTPEQIDEMVYPDVTDDRVFGYLTRLNIADFFDPDKLTQLQQEIKQLEKASF